MPLMLLQKKCGKEYNTYRIKDGFNVANNALICNGQKTQQRAVPAHFFEKKK